MSDTANWLGRLEVGLGNERAIFFYGEDPQHAYLESGGVKLAKSLVDRLTYETVSRHVELFARSPLAIWVVLDQELDTACIYEMNQERYSRLLEHVEKCDDREEILSILSHLLRKKIPYFFGRPESETNQK